MIEKMQFLFQTWQDGYQSLFQIIYSHPLSVLLVQGSLDVIRRHVDELFCLP